MFDDRLSFDKLDLKLALHDVVLPNSFVTVTALLDTNSLTVLEISVEKSLVLLPVPNGVR